MCSIRNVRYNELRFAGISGGPQYNTPIRKILAKHPETRIFGALSSSSLCLLSFFRGLLQGPTLGAHAHYRPCPWVLGGHGCNMFMSGHGWVWLRCYWAWVGMGFIL